MAMPPRLPTSKTTAKAVLPGSLAALRIGKKLVLYGAPAVGKTTLTASLVEAGWNVVYVDLDGNPEPYLDLLPEQLHRVTYIPLRETSHKPTRYKALIELSDIGKISWCEEHNIHKCPACTEFVEWDSKTVDWSNTIFILDSYTSIHRSCTYATYVEHNLDDAAKLDIPHFGTVNRLNNRAIDWVMNSTANCVLVTHRASKLGLTEKGAEKWYPVLGSQNQSMNVPMFVNALWYLKSPTTLVLEKPLDGAVDAFTRGGVAKYKGLTPSKSIAAFFGKP